MPFPTLSNAETNRKNNRKCIRTLLHLVMPLVFPLRSVQIDFNDIFVSGLVI